VNVCECMRARALIQIFTQVPAVRLSDSRSHANTILSIHSSVLLKLLYTIIQADAGENANYYYCYCYSADLLYSSPNIIRVIKSRIMRWRACGTYGGEERLLEGFGGET
jgi:hypothetical protein